MGQRVFAGYTLRPCDQRLLLLPIYEKVLAVGNPRKDGSRKSTRPLRLLVYPAFAFVSHEKIDRQPVFPCTIASSNSRSKSHSEFVTPAIIAAGGRN